MLYYTVPSIVKKDITSPGLHYGWHLRIKSIFYTKTKNKNTKPRYNTHKRQQNNRAKIGQRNYSYSTGSCKTRGKYCSAWFIPVIHLSNAEQNKRNSKEQKQEDGELGTGNCCWFDIAVSIKSARILYE